MLTLLLLGGMANSAWAYKITYHILTLPMTADRPGNTKSEYYTWRMEALRVIVDNVTTLQPLPNHFQSPLAENFQYYADESVTKYAGAQQIYAYHSQNKYYLYKITGEDTPDDADNQAPLTIGDPITSNCNIYVTYDYNATNTIAKLDGSENYNIIINGGFLAYNKGRNNRLAVIPEKYNDEYIVSGEQLCSNEFVKVDLTGKNTGITTWWNGNKTPRTTADSYFHFLFKYKGCDPYNITICTAYEGDDCYYEKYNTESIEHKKYYKWSSVFTTAKQVNDNLLISSADNREYTTPYNSADPVAYTAKPGYYHNVGGHVWNSFALLNNSDNSGYVYVGTRCVDQNGNIGNPSNNQYYYLKAESNLLVFFLMTVATASDYSTDREMYETHTYTFKVKTPFGNVIEATKDWPEAYNSEELLDHIPDALKRKYANFVGAYTDETQTNGISTFAESNVADNGRVIWLKYTTSMPFEALPADGNYTDARWYTIRANNVDANMVYYDSSADKFYTGLGSNSNLHQGESEGTKTQVAFMGDPFELKILSHLASEEAEPSANRYIGCPTSAEDGDALSSQEGSLDGGGVPEDISTWEIAYDATSGSMVLRQYGTYDNPKYIGWADAAVNKPITYSSTSTRLKVVELEKKTYVYHIYNASNQIAVMASDQQDIGKPLKVSAIPELIRSPFLSLPGVTIKFYYTSEDALADTHPQIHAPFNVTSEANKDIYVRYFGMADALSVTRVHFHTDQFFNVDLNGQYLYFNKDGEGNININSKETITDDEADDDEYMWRLEGQDPYDMKVYNEGAYQNNTSIAQSYITTTFTDEAPLTFDVVGNAKSFVALSGAQDKTFEVMAATGDALDVSTNYYHIGRKEDNSVKMYNKSSALHGSGSITFVLTQPDANVVYYHLIDKNNTDLLQVRNRYELLYFPTDFRSPLVVQYHYYPTEADALAGTNELTENASIATLKDAGTIADRNADGYLDVYITYDVTDAVDMLNKKTMYLLKFAQGTPFKAENGSDGLEEIPVTPVYPYCNGDCNFFVYGQDQFDLQQQGAASTRTRWAWFLESAQNDPYHVKICSRQTETYNTDELRAYFCTYQPTGYNQVVTGLVWPSISGIQGTEYMIIGATGHYRLVTADSVSLDADHNGTPESRQRYTVTSFEQYWKTYDTVRRKILKQGATDYPADPDEPQTVPATPYVVGDDRYTSNRTYLTDEMNFHNYNKWAYAKRWNGYNSSGKTSKGWEEIEHWFQTVEMGEGIFDLVPIDINPVLILLDQHGWEIMRKPLPTSPDDDTKDTKYDAIRPYDSPMVKEYYFWTKASKRSGFHQYYNLSQQVYNNGKPFTSTSLTDLPPYYTATNLRDAKGNHLDEYVTYSVKDEYIQTYNASTGEGQPFLIQQGSHFAYNNGDDAAIGTYDVPTTGGMSQYIIDNAANFDVTNGSKKNELWYVKPNARIDYEMGYVDSTATTTLNHDWTNDYTGAFSNGFDPYNIQISSVASNTKYFVTNATGATLEEGAGSLKGRYDSDPIVALGTPEDDIPCSWYDSRALAITNATFMAVQDASGNMQLMPRFDHDRRMKDFTTLTLPTDPAIDQTFTQIFRPLVYNYHIIDNEGRESLRYQSGGDMVPQTPEWFKSQLAKDFTYYKTLTSTGINTYNLGTLADEITESLAGAGLTTSGTDGNRVYVRYSYDEDADFDHLLKGNWHTMTLNEKDTKYDGGIKQGSDKPSTIDKNQKVWQWKFTATPQSEPDPYAVSLYNRSQSGATSVNGQTRFALLNYYDNNATDPTKYTLAVAGTGNTTYQFVDGYSMTTAVAATTATESGFTSTSCSYDGTKAQIVLSHDVIHEFIYKIYTNGGVFAISATQDNETVEENNHVPIVPDSIVSPLLNADQFRYYNKDNFTFSDGNIATADTIGKALTYVYGLYDDEICVRYTAYNPLATSYKVPNVRNTTGSGQVERANTSNDASIGINNEYLYNIIWHNDNMMTGTDANAITGGGSQDLGGSPSGQVWYFVGNDPYAIKLRTHVNDVDRYVHKSGDASCNLTTTAGEATTFMLLPREDNYEYGMFQITGASSRLTDYGGTLTTDAPNKFIIFALSTHMVTYHLVIANINSQVTLYDNNNQSVITVDGTTQRDLTNYPIADYPAGHVSLGDPFKVPTQMYRRNVDYFFYVGDIYNVDAYGVDNGKNDELTARYKGHCVTAMGDDPDLVGKHVHIYIVYTFQGGLATNAGDGFVTNVTQNKWYTFEAQKADGTPLLAQFTNAWGMEVKEGRGTHYTNDYLWSPIGDPYGFKMFHRYTYVNSGSDNQGEPHRVMTTSTPNPFTEGKPVTMGYDNDVYDANSVYELLAEENTTQGYFKIHPVANSTSTQYYFKIFHDWENPEDHTTPEHDYVRLSSDDYTEFRFGLSEDLVKPYYDRAGYVGGLTTVAKAAYKAVDDNDSYTEQVKLMEKQKIVYNPDNIVKYEPGYYRLHSPEDIAGITVRYASGYTHKTELTGDGVLTTSAIPMHFYERKGVNTTFEILANGFTRSAATQGAIPISEPMYDPASVLYFYEGSSSTPLSRVQTQGLYLKGAKGPGLDGGGSVIAANVEAANERAAAIMVDTENPEDDATPLYIMDIGGAILLIHDNVTGERRGYLKYLSFDQNEANHIHDLKLTHNTHTDHAKWLMEPVNAQGIALSVHSGGDAEEYGTTYYYSTWYAPFDVLLPDDVDGKRYVAYTCVAGDSPWPVTAPATTGYLHPKPIGTYNAEPYDGNNKFIPAGTPALIATTDNAGVIKMTIPTSSPSSSISTIFNGQYLEQLLSTGNIVYSFGLPFTSELEMNASGVITGTLPTQADNGVGFYINANPNKEIGPSRDSWTRNNRYVLHNKIYYRAAGGGGGAPDQMRDVQYVPVIFGDGDEGEDPKEEKEGMTERREYIGDNCVYDLLGRKVLSAEDVLNGTWRHRLQPGIYILNGHKFYVGVGWM